MPDKHEVGGSSPLGPTRIFQIDFEKFTSSLFTLHFSRKRKREKRSKNGDNYKPKQFGGVAQLGEHLPCKQGVMGSNPIISTSPKGQENVH